MFKKTILTYSSLVFTLLAGWLYLTLHISGDDQKKFKQLQLKAQAIAKASDKIATKQNRMGVRKDLWITQEGGIRFHDRIESAFSTLTLTPIDDHLDIIENLHQIRCSMQDRFVEQDGAVFQQIRCFDADSGIYQYSLNRFTAQSVSLALYRLPGKDLPSTYVKNAPFLKGIAQDVSFAIAGKASQFQAKHFKATFVGKKDD